MKKNYKNNLIIVFLITLLTLYIINSSLIVESIIDYTLLFTKKLFPASFIFFIISSLLIDYNFIEKISRLLHINGAVFYVVVMSMISGFPSGSKYIKDLYIRNIISVKTANYLICFTHFPNPIFILGSVSSLFTNKYYAVYILISLILSNLLIGLISKPKEKNSIIYNYKDYKSFSLYLSDAIINSSRTMIIIYGISLFFYLIITVINHYFSFDLYPYVFFNGLFDLTKGIFLTSVISNDIVKSILIILFISFGGISINMQVKSIISDTPISYKKFFIARLYQAVISAIIFLNIIYWTNYIN